MTSKFLKQSCKKSLFKVNQAKKDYILSRGEKAPQSKHLDQIFSNLLNYHKKSKHILKIRKGLYARIPESFDGDYKINPFLIASKLTDDSIIGYHSALSFWGVLHSVRNNYIYLTKRKLSESEFSFQGITYKGVSYPSKLLEKNKELLGVVKQNVEGEEMLITSLERTFVDILDRPYLIANDWEEIYRSFESIAYLNIDVVIDYVLTLENQTTLARVGYFLELFKETWLIEERYIQKLKKYVPKFILFMDRKSHESQKIVKNWNIMVPESLYYKNWEEPYEDI